VHGAPGALDHDLKDGPATPLNGLYDLQGMGHHDRPPATEVATQGGALDEQEIGPGGQAAANGFGSKLGQVLQLTQKLRCSLEDLA
jgi:hypothetical protein